MSDKNKVSRRDLLKAAGIAGVGLTAASIGSAHADDYSETAEASGRRRGGENDDWGEVDQRDVVRLGIVGAGYVARAARRIPGD